MAVPYEEVYVDMVDKPHQQVFERGKDTDVLREGYTLGDLEKLGFVFLRAESKLLKITKATGKPGQGQMQFQRQTRLWFRAPKKLLGI